tara:strand:- start:107 stop:451 length:345 start_codon:yes stop_codon:yes gene_type:complete
MIRVVAILLATMASQTWADGSIHYPVPNQKAIDWLLADPSTAPQFDGVFGQGKAAEFLPRETEPRTKIASPKGPFVISPAEKILWMADPISGRIRFCTTDGLKKPPVCSPWSHQ